MRRAYTAIAVIAFLVALPAVGRAQVEPGFVPVYTYNLPTGANFNTTAPGPTVTVSDLSGSIAAGSFDRVAYLLTLGGSANTTASPNGSVYVSFDTPTTDATKLGIPYRATGAAFQQAVTNMNVSSTVAGVTTGTGLTNGRIEFWPDDYSEGLNGVYDYDDNRSGGGNYGSMQVFAGTATVFAYNDWGADTGTSDIGIGTNTTVSEIFNTSETNPDWTFRSNADDYTTRTLQVFVRPVPEPASAALLACGAGCLLARRRGRPA